ncbi:hypothetical protein ACFU9B_43460 [Streptomyces sp. NPDC057592]|uniref:hypothetical protein n=1 Tax=unclassified Streptomyces TaxID=2593676 RepID=UPI00368ABE7F
MDRIATPTGVITVDRPSAGQYEDWESDDNELGPEAEPESALRIVTPTRCISIRPDQPDRANCRYATRYQGSRGGWGKLADESASRGQRR